MMITSVIRLRLFLAAHRAEGQVRHDHAACPAAVK